ncbi:Uncharacterized protein QTN25_010794 [Entamoeba marina]
MYTQDTQTLLQTIYYLPSIIERIPTHHFNRTIDDCISHLNNVIALIDENKPSNYQQIINQVTDVFFTISSSTKRSLQLLLTLIKNCVIESSTIQHLNNFCNSINEYPTIFLSLQPQELITLLSLEMPIPLVINTQHLYTKLLDIIPKVPIFPLTCLSLLSILNKLNGQQLDPNTIHALSTTITRIETEDIKEQREMVEILQNYIFSHSSKQCYDLYYNILNDSKYREIWVYTLHLFRTNLLLCVNTSTKENMNCCDNLSIFKESLNNYLLKLLSHDEYLVLDKFTLIKLADEIVEVVSFIRFVVYLRICDCSVSELLEKCNKIYSNMLNIRSLLLQGLTDQDKKQLEQAKKICNITTNDGKMDIDIDGALERNTGKIELTIYSLQNTIKSLQTFTKS